MSKLWNGFEKTANCVRAYYQALGINEMGNFYEKKKHHITWLLFGAIVFVITFVVFFHLQILYWIVASRKVIQLLYLNRCFVYREQIVRAAKMEKNEAQAILNKMCKSLESWHFWQCDKVDSTIQRQIMGIICDIGEATFELPVSK